MLTPFTHDWRPGDRVVSIAVRESVADTGLGTIQRVLLDKAIILWDDGEQSEERLQDLIIAGFNPSKIVFSADEHFGHRGQKDWWTGSSINVTQDVSSEVAINERLIINQMMISGLPLSIDNMKGIAWGSFINENFKQGS
ncbi:MAG: hypothetical protein HOC18_06715 [Candidatus Marinimicrobia bacterium]|jgi:hypothetical protein|nr:hypothetical protein [Candidatus Neomarinimicrobiota bacterium]